MSYDTYTKIYYGIPSPLDGHGDPLHTCEVFEAAATKYGLNFGISGNFVLGENIVPYVYVEERDIYLGDHTPLREYLRDTATVLEEQDIKGFLKHFGFSVVDFSWHITSSYE